LDFGRRHVGAGGRRARERDQEEEGTQDRHVGWLAFLARIDKRDGVAS
jgi:hypothetical protein